MLTSLRPWLAGARLLLVYLLLCFIGLYSVLLLNAQRSAAIGLHGPQPEPVDVPFMGINVALDQYTSQQQTEVLQRLAAHGFGWVRIRLDWATLEPEPGAYRWRRTDRMLAAVRSAGLTPVITLDGSPAWAHAPVDRQSAQGNLAPPADYSDFARFAAKVAERYGEHLRYYQIWDEPNIAPHWGRRHIRPTAYADLLQSAADAVRAADPDAYILPASLAPTGDRGHTAMDEVHFLQRLYAAGAASAFDAVALQPFGFRTTPTDPTIAQQSLNFQRARLIRQAMVNAGEGAKPIWFMRYGWNRYGNSTWGTVSPANQLDFSITALELAYSSWPWVVAQAWAIDRPDANFDDPIWGFSLTPTLETAFAAWEKDHSGPRPQQSPPVRTHPTDWLMPVGLLGATLVLLWRARCAYQQCSWLHPTGPWHPRATMRGAIANATTRITKATSTQTPNFTWRRLLGGGLVLGVYYFATWPPLIIACWLAAAWAIYRRPAWGLHLSLFLIPFHIYYKELDLGAPLLTGALRTGPALYIPPAYAALLCTLPALRRHAYRRLSIHDPWLWPAVAWLGIGLLSVVNAWHGAGYRQGLVSLVLVPLLLFATVRCLAPSRSQQRDAAVALALGGVTAAALGLILWFQDGGTVVDGLRRLDGFTFSPNHTALYLGRTLMLALALYAAAGRRIWLGAAALVAAALLLTGSRGGLLLSLPAGLLVLGYLLPTRRGLPAMALPAFPWMRSERQRPRRILPWIGLLLLVVAALWMNLPDSRLTNVETILRRWEIWQASAQIWLDFPLLGVGPGGFYWQFPAYLPMQSDIDPNLQHPHNIWLELLTQSGVLGLAWFVALVAAIGLTWRRTGRTALQAGLLAGLAAGFAHAQVDAWQALPDLAAWNWTALALLFPASPAQSSAANPKTTKPPSPESPI